MATNDRGLDPSTVAHRGAHRLPVQSDVQHVGLRASVQHLGGKIQFQVGFNGTLKRSSRLDPPSTLGQIVLIDAMMMMLNGDRDLPIKAKVL